MNETITIDGIDYEVLTLDLISEITHAKLAGGKVVNAETNLTDFWVWSPTLEHADATCFDVSELADYGIQPLKLIERVPVSFVAGTAIVTFDGHDILAIIPPGDAVLGMKFRCVQITEEA